jgi:hypothetical protein
MMKRVGLLLFIFMNSFSHAQSAWPSENWNTAAPLTSVMSSTGLLELSGLHWNPVTNRLYVVHGDGRLRVLQLNTATNTFTQIGNRVLSGGPEGVTQADYGANQFYTIDEDNYLIKQYSNLANFGSVTLTTSWNLLNAPSPMEDTGNTGPEGITFVPDENLANAGFTSSVTGQPYTSTKGAGGLFFISHQDGGYIWVFDLNPNVNNDFAYVGKYKTGRNESCDLAFDRSTGLLYILHNLGSNYLEVTDLTLAASASEATFHTVSEYYLSNPADGNINIEGFAVMPKCGSTVTGSAFLCRDVEETESNNAKFDAIRWFDPFTANGICLPLETKNFDEQQTSVYPNPSSDYIRFAGISGNILVKVNDILGQTILSKRYRADEPLDVSACPTGVYAIEITDQEKRLSVFKWIKQ